MSILKKPVKGTKSKAGKKTAPKKVSHNTKSDDGRIWTYRMRDDGRIDVISPRRKVYTIEDRPMWHIEALVEDQLPRQFGEIGALIPEGAGKPVFSVSYLRYDDASKDGFYEEFLDPYPTLEKANRAAKDQWYHLTPREKKRSHVHVVIDFDDGTQISPAGAWDSDVDGRDNSHDKISRNTKSGRKTSKKKPGILGRRAK